MLWSIGTVLVVKVEFLKKKMTDPLGRKGIYIMLKGKFEFMSSRATTWSSQSSFHSSVMPVRPVFCHQYMEKF